VVVPVAPPNPGGALLWFAVGAVVSGLAFVAATLLR